MIAPGERYDVVVDFSGLAGETVSCSPTRRWRPGRQPGPAADADHAVPRHRAAEPGQPAGGTPSIRPRAPLTADEPPAAALNAPGPANTRYHPSKRSWAAAGPLGARHQRQVLRGPQGQDPGQAAGLPVRPRQPGRGRPGGPGQRQHRGLGVRQHHGRHAPDAHAPGAVRRDRAAARSTLAGYLAALAAARAATAEAGTPLLTNNATGPDAGPTSWPARRHARAGVNRLEGHHPAHPGEVTRSARSSTSRRTSRPHQDYVYHCHILEHESNSMMRPYRVRRVTSNHDAAGAPTVPAAPRGIARRTRMPNIGPLELIVVLVIALLILGPKAPPGRRSVPRARHPRVQGGSHRLRCDRRGDDAAGGDRRQPVAPAKVDVSPGTPTDTSGTACPSRPEGRGEGLGASRHRCARHVA